MQHLPTQLSRPLRVGMIGAGMIARFHVPAWLALGAKVHVSSIAGSESLADEFGLTAVSQLDELWSHVDLVDIATPTDTHASLAREAILRGKHVICEKPLALTSGAAAELATAAEQAGVRLFPGHVVRYFPEYLAAREAIQAGQIGRLAVLRFRRQSAAPVPAWFFDETRSGGIIMDQMIHDLDQASWLAGPVTRVFARVRRGGHDDQKIAAHVILDHESGAISHVHGTWGAPTLPFSYSFDIAGDAGVLRFDSARVDTARRAIGGSDADYRPTTGERDPFEQELADFVGAIQSGTDARVTAEDGVRAVHIAEAAQASAATGKPQRVGATAPEYGAAS